MIVEPFPVNGSGKNANDPPLELTITVPVMSFPGRCEAIVTFTGPKGRETVLSIGVNDPCPFSVLDGVYFPNILTFPSVVVAVTILHKIVLSHLSRV
jgi:hypothetical protein